MPRSCGFWGSGNLVSLNDQARRTLRVMLGKAVRDGLIHQAPRIHLAEETGRDGILDDATEAKLLEVANQPKVASPITTHGTHSGRR